MFIVCFQKSDFLERGPGIMYISIFHWQGDKWEGMGRDRKGKKKGNPQQRSSSGWLLAAGTVFEGKALPTASVVNQVSLLQPYGSARG